MPLVLYILIYNRKGKYDISMHQVKIYTTPTCGYCKMAKEYFKEHSVAYEEYDVVTDAAKQQEMMQKTGRMAVPVIDIDGTIVEGFDREKINELLGINKN